MCSEWPPDSKNLFALSFDTSVGLDPHFILAVQSILHCHSRACTLQGRVVDSSHAHWVCVKRLRISVSYYHLLYKTQCYLQHPIASLP